MALNTITIEFPDRVWANAFILWCEQNELKDFFDSKEATVAESSTGIDILNFDIDMDYDEDNVNHVIRCTE